MIALEHITPRVPRPVLPAVSHDAEMSEIYRQVYVSLRFPPDVRAVVLGVTSAISGEGRTTVALGLAHTLASDLETPVVLVEVDLERPALATHFGLAPSPGLGEVLRGETHLHAVRQPVSHHLSVVTTGTIDADAARLLRQLHITDPFHDDAELGMEGVVILDLPPIINHSYSPLAASVADATILVVRAGVTPVKVVREAIARMEDMPPQGVVFNAPHSSLPRWLRGHMAP